MVGHRHVTFASWTRARLRLGSKWWEVGRGGLKAVRGRGSGHRWRPCWVPSVPRSQLSDVPWNSSPGEFWCCTSAGALSSPRYRVAYTSEAGFCDWWSSWHSESWSPSRWTGCLWRQGRITVISSVWWLKIRQVGSQCLRTFQGEGSEKHPSVTNLTTPA